MAYQPIGSSSSPQEVPQPRSCSSVVSLVAAIILPIIIGLGIALAAYFYFHQPIWFAAVVGALGGGLGGIVSFVCYRFIGRNGGAEVKAETEAPRIIVTAATPQRAGGAAPAAAPRPSPMPPSGSPAPAAAPRPTPTPESIPVIETLVDYPGDLSFAEMSRIEAVPEGETRLKLEFQEADLQEFNVSIRNEDLFASGAQVIVNAANTHLGGGGGIDGAIHGRGGAAYAAAHRALQTKYNRHYPEGAAAIIPSGALQELDGIIDVIVVAGPKGRARQLNDGETPIQDDDPEKAKKMFSCYWNALLLAHQRGKTSLAIPILSIGEFKFPAQKAAPIVLRAFYNFAKTYPGSPLKSISLHFMGKNRATGAIENWLFPIFQSALDPTS